MKLMSLKEFRETAYSDQSAPTVEYLRKMVQVGDLPGFRDHNGRYWVDYEAFARKIDGAEEDDPVLEKIRKAS